MSTSAQRNKNLLKKEEQLLKTIASRDSLLNFESSESGFLFAYKKQDSQNNAFPKKG